MPTNIQERSGGFQLRITHKLLPRPFFHTFATRPDAESYATELNACLAGGVVPHEVMLKLVAPKRSNDLSVDEILDGYLREQKSASETDHELVGYVRREFPGVRFTAVTYDAAVEFAERLRVVRHLAPGTIRARVGLMGRVWDWFLAKNGQTHLANPWRRLPEGYSIATTEEQKRMHAAGLIVRRDQQRERRLHEGEEERIIAVLAGQKFLDRERALGPSAELAVMFHMIVNTGMRLRECYTLTPERVHLSSKENYLALEGTKGHRGGVKPRDVPLRPKLRQMLSQWMGQMAPGQDRLFPDSWDGSREEKSLRGSTNRLSQQFTNLFEHALCPDLHEHDLRHEATCRWVLLKDKRGDWLFRETEIIRIMGWADAGMMLRYASLRGADMSGRLDHLDALEEA